MQTKSEATKATKALEQNYQALINKMLIQEEDKYVFKAEFFLKVSTQLSEKELDKICKKIDKKKHKQYDQKLFIYDKSTDAFRALKKNSDVSECFNRELFYPGRINYSNVSTYRFYLKKSYKNKTVKYIYNEREKKDAEVQNKSRIIAQKKQAIKNQSTVTFPKKNLKVYRDNASRRPSLRWFVVGGLGLSATGVFLVLGLHLLGLINSLPLMILSCLMPFAVGIVFLGLRSISLLGCIDVCTTKQDVCASEPVFMRKVRNAHNNIDLINTQAYILDKGVPRDLKHFFISNKKTNNINNEHTYEVMQLLQGKTLKKYFYL